MTNFIDNDPIETQEWLEALDNLFEYADSERAAFILNQLQAHANQRGLTAMDSQMNTAYLNSLGPEQEKKLPDDEALQDRITNIIRWNAIAMVLRAGKKAPELGGHIATYASAALLYEVGFNHFFRAATTEHGGDLLYIQGHVTPGIYGRAFLEGRLTEEQIGNFRQEISGQGVSSYPHPWLMKDFWQFATVSMGLGPLQAIYQAQFLKYLHNRGLQDTSQRKVWAFCGDGEMDEPESLGALTFAARENLDNLIFVINCNLQRLDGPVHGNGKIIQEFEGAFRGAGWNVIKVIWGRAWQPLLDKDKQGFLRRRMQEVVDGEYQNYNAKDGAYIREHFFGKYPELLEMVAEMSDTELKALNLGGHDWQRVYAAYAAATNHQHQPTVILVKTIKGYGMGAAGEAMNTTHQQKKMSFEDLKAFRDRFKLPLTDKQVEEVSFYRPEDDSPEIKYLQQQRKKLGGYLPARRLVADEALEAPSLDAFKAILEGSGDRENSTTMVFVRILSTLLKDKRLKERVVPIVADESRTFGMEGLFRQLGIYAPSGQLYKPVDASQVMYYREEKDGQVLQEGINEAGAFSAWLAAATSYSVNNLPMIPFYIYYSMFGFQRIGDLAWAAGDMQARGFLLGATAGRTTLAGEGLQHQDGHSHLYAATIPNCRAYDPTYGYELAVIIQDGLRRMYQEQEDIFYYITVMNENYQHPAIPEGVEEGILKGLYRLKQSNVRSKMKVTLLGAGTILREVEKAAEILEQEYKVTADVWSATSFNELRREALEVEHYNNFHPTEKPKTSYVTECLSDTGPIIAATDYMRAYAEQIRAFVPASYTVLGTDGYGRSDTRKALREFFEVDYRYIVVGALRALVDDGQLKGEVVAKAMEKLGINENKSNPTQV